MNEKQTGRGRGGFSPLRKSLLFGLSDPTYPSWPAGAGGGKTSNRCPYQGVNGTTGDRAAHRVELVPPWPGRLGWTRGGSGN